jgi:hypothetical protein
MPTEIAGSAHPIKGHLAGSHRYRTNVRSSDYDFSFEDNPWTRQFLKAAGFKLVMEFPVGTRGNSTSHWKQTYYNCEVFLTRHDNVKRQATRIMRFFQWCEIMHDKKYRVRLWTALELCLTTVWAVRSEYRAAKQKVMADGFSLRDRPIQDRTPQ